MVQHDKSSANLVADTARELAAPTAAVLEHVNLLEETALTAEQRGLLDVIRRSALNLKALAEDLRSLTSPEPKRVVVSADPFDVHETIENAVSVLMPSVYRQGLDLVLMIYRDVPTRLIGDAPRLQQVLSQLVLMAVRSSIEGSVTLRVMLENETPETARLRFNLTLGLGAQGLDSVADPADSFPSLSPGHAQRLVKMLGGEMLTTPGPEGGSTFLLPLAKPAQSTAALAWPGLIGRSIRVFDNDLSSRRALLHHLEAWGVKNPQHGAISNLGLPSGNDSNDCVILGLRPGELERSELPAFLGAMRARRIPALCLVASFDENVHRRLREMGATASLPKSTNRLTLYRVLARLIGTVGGGQERRLTYMDLPVLVADDVEANRRILKVMLEQLGAKPALAAGGVEALHLWRSHRHPLVLMDVRMPDMDGVSVARSIRALEENGPGAVIVGVTAALDAPLRRQLLDAGMNDCILKPTDKRSLIRDLNSWVIPPLGTPEESGTEPAAAPMIEDLGAARELLTQNPELAKLLLESLPLQLQSLESAVRSGKTATINEELHQLHGTAAFYRLERLKQIAGSLEAQARKDRLLIADQLPPLRDSINGVVESLRQFVKI